MKRSNLAIALSLAAALPFAAQAQEAPSNTWVEGSYVNADGDAEGHAVRGSFEFGESNVYGLAGVTRLEVDNSPLKLDGRELGLGYAHPLSERTDLFAEAAGIALTHVPYRGTGPALAHPPRAFIRAMEAHGIGVEAMDSRAAARAWGVLRAEERWIVGALLPL